MLANKNLTDIAIIEAYYSLKKKKTKNRQTERHTRARTCVHTNSTGFKGTFKVSGEHLLFQ